MITSWLNCLKPFSSVLWLWLLFNCSKFVLACFCITHTDYDEKNACGSCFIKNAEELHRHMSALGHKGNNFFYRCAHFCSSLFLLLAYVSTAQSLHCSQAVLDEVRFCGGWAVFLVSCKQLLSGIQWSFECASVFGLRGKVLVAWGCRGGLYQGRPGAVRTSDRPSSIHFQNGPTAGDSWAVSNAGGAPVRPYFKEGEKGCLYSQPFSGGREGKSEGVRGLVGM